ncbi:MAG: radical SAM family heme chaperone HemW [Cyclobacteriaceae bacterium]
MAGIYIHVPFCKKACHYCDFHFSTQQNYVAEMVQALQKEISLQSGYLSEPLETIYFGGGTPSLLSEKQLGKLLASVGDAFDTSGVNEITLEANPDDINEDKLRQWHEIGINRLSMGVQSFDDATLRMMNRVHGSAETYQCLQLITQSQINNVSVDLIYSVPNQSMAVWLESIKQLLAFRPQHISAYSLTIEERTVFGKWVSQHKLSPVDEGESAAQFEALIDMLEQAGYEQYEISNFSLPGFFSKHNTNYWRGVPYLGIGPSAHSFDGNSRQSNIRNNALYMKAIQAGSVPFEREALSRENKINEFIYTSLRTKWGCDLNELQKRLQFDLLAAHRAYINDLVAKGFAQLDNQTLKLLRPGRLLADQIAMDLFLPA